MSAPAISLRGVSKSYRGRAVLSAVDLDVREGGLTVLVGASGSGKTTLLRIIAGLERPDEGTVSVKDRVVADASTDVPPERRGVALVFQSLELWPHMTAAENVAFGLPGRPRGRRALADPRVVRAAADVGLSAAVLSRTPATLSGGERQRLALARALAPAPSVVLYDEPLAHLDRERRGDLRRLLRMLHAERSATFLYVTHDPDEALEMGEEVVVLDGGRVVDRGPPLDVYRRPTSLAGARALGAVSLVPASADAGRLRTALGEFPTSASGDGVRSAGLRPEQVALVERDGRAARVLDAYPRDGAVFAFTAALADAPTVRVAGLATRPLSRGDVVSVAVRGAPFALREEAAPERTAALGALAPTPGSDT